MRKPQSNIFVVLGVFVLGVVVVVSSQGNQTLEAPSRIDTVAAVADDQPIEAPAQIVRESVDPGESSMPRDTSLIGVREPASDQVAETEPVLPGRRDARVLKLYKALCDARTKAAPAAGAPDARLKWNLSRLDAMAKLIKQDRFYYLGNPENAPTYQNTANVRYFSTQLDGLRVIFEVQLWEFPDVFNKPKLGITRTRRSG